MEKITKDIKEKDRPSVIMKGDEFFNKGDIILAYQCYKMASYPSGIEKIGDFYFFTKHDLARAVIFYKQAVKEISEKDSDEAIKIKEKIKKSAVKIAEVLRKWMEEDKVENRDKITNKAYVAMVEAAVRNKFHTRDNGEKK